MGIVVPYFQIRANAIILYGQPERHYGRRYQLPMPKLSTYSGKVTTHAQKRLMKALDLLVQRSPIQRIHNTVTGTDHDFKLNFITLTVANQKNMAMQDGHRLLLAPWIRYMRRKQGMKDYVWKGEYQRRGQIHYHVGTNCYIPWPTVRWQWNQNQRRAGLLDDFARKHRHYNPPSTDVHGMRNVQDCLSYIAKEMCKKNQNQITTKGKVWDCNRELKRDRYSDIITTDMEDLIDDAIQHGFAERIDTEHCTIVRTDNPLAFLTQKEKAQYQQHITA